MLFYLHYNQKTFKDSENQVWAFTQAENKLGNQ